MLGSIAGVVGDAIFWAFLGAALAVCGAGLWLAIVELWQSRASALPTDSRDLEDDGELNGSAR